MLLSWHTRPEHMNPKLHNKQECLLLGQGRLEKVSSANHAGWVSSPL